MGRSKKTKLTTKQLLFCKEYIVDFNASRAAVAAGYSKKTSRSIGSENLTKPDIQAQIKKEVEARKDRIELSQDKVLEEMAKLAFSDIKDFVEFEEGGGIRIKTLEEIPEGMTGAIKEVTEDRVIREVNSKGGDDQTAEVVVHDRVKYRLHDKITPLIKLGLHMGLTFEKVSVNGKMKLIHDMDMGMGDLMKAYLKVKNGDSDSRSKPQSKPD